MSGHRRRRGPGRWDQTGAFNEAALKRALDEMEADMTRDQREALEVIRANPELMILPSSNGRGARVGRVEREQRSYIWCNDVILSNLAGRGHVQRIGDSYIYELAP
jgi:hypothetical protein